MNRIRNRELERAIVAAPDDPTTRMVYGDWLQEHGSPLGAWIALWSAMEKQPDDLVLRGQAIAYQAEHQDELFGDGLPAIQRGYIGWAGGFVDELRIVKLDSPAVETVEALFACPVVQLVRHVAIEDLATPIEQVIDALVAAELPLLDELVVYDAVVAGRPAVQVDAIAELRLRRLALSNVKVAAPMPTLRELYVAFGRDDTVAWIENGGCPALDKVTFVDASEPPVLPPGIAVAHLDAMSVYGMPAEVEHNPLEDLVRAGDRATLRMIPGAGTPIYNLGTTYLQGDLRDAVMFCDVAATLPAGERSHELNAAIAHEKAGDAIHAELRAREALVRRPGDEGLYEILIDALRQQRRFDEAFRLFPKAVAAIANPIHTDGRDRACLLDLMLTCVLAGVPERARALANDFPQLVDDRHHALFAIAALDGGDEAAARASWARVTDREGSDEGIVHHARALFLCKDDGGGTAYEHAIAEAKRLGYTDLAWMAETCARATGSRRY